MIPVKQWIEALRLRILPDAPQRFTLINPDIWQRTRQAIEAAQASAMDLEHAACQMLFDIWLWITETYDEPAESPFHRLSELTRPLAHPPLRIAHCIRDIAHGQARRIDELKQLVDSPDPAYRQIFEDAFWRDPETLPSKRRKRSRRRQKRGG